MTGAFQGTVTSSATGEPVAGATALIINQQTGQTYTKTSDQRGRFYQGLLQPGVYTIRVSAQGFATAEVVQRLFITKAGEVVPVPVSLDPVPAAAAGATPTPQPALTEEDTDVRARINATDGRQSGSFTEREVSNLPLGGTTLFRTFDELTLLLPGVAPPPQTLGTVAGPGIGAGVGSAGQFSVNGLRSRANNFTVDGSDNNDEDIGVRRQGFVALNSQPIESVKEYQAITLLAPAQFGRNIGAQVNAVSKSGGETTHGEVYGLFNSSRLNARDFFDTTNGNAATPLLVGDQRVVTATGRRPDLLLGVGRLRFFPINPVPVVVRNQSGGKDSFTLGQGGIALGGPLSDAAPGANPSMFYFISAEGHLLHATKEANFAVPTVSQRGMFVTGATSNVTLNDRVTGAPVNRFTFPVGSTGGNSIFSLFPFPNNPNGVYGANTLTQQLPANAEGKILSGKFDGNFKYRGRQQSLTARYNFTQDWREIPVTGGAVFSTLRPRVRTQNLSIFLNSEVTGVGSTRPVFNQVRLSYGRTRLDFEEVRDQEFLLPSVASDPVFGSFGLLNARLLENLTSPGATAGRVVANIGDVFYFTNPACGTTSAPRNCTTEDEIGPVGQVIIAGFSPVGIDVNNFPQRRVNNTYQLADTLTLRAGDHSYVFGADTRRTELNSDLPRNARQLITFNGVPTVESVPTATQGLFRLPSAMLRPEDLAAAGAATGSYLTLAAPGNSNINLRFYQLNFFGQDSWRVRPNLSLSYGLRYEYNTPPREANRRIEDTFDSAELNLAPGLRDFIAGRTRIFDPDRNNFAPRVGMAYSPNLFGRTGRTTVIRAGYGLFYDQILGAVVSQSRNVFPSFLTLNLAGGQGNEFFGTSNGFLSISNVSSPTSFQGIPFVRPGTPNVPFSTTAFNISLANCRIRGGGPGCIGQPTARIDANPVGVTMPARRLDTPLAHHYSFTVEQQLGTNVAVSASYVGTLGRNLLRFTTPNLGPNNYTVVQSLGIASNVNTTPVLFGFSLTPGARPTPSNTFAGGRPNRGVGVVNLFETTAASRYDSLQLQLRGWVRRSLQYQAAYTFSKALDEVSDVFDLAGAFALPQDSFDLAAERGLANFDARHRLSYHFAYDLPALNSAGGITRALLGGFRLAGTGRFQTGQPFTVNSIFDVNLDGNLTDRLDNTGGLVMTGDRHQPLRLTTSDLTTLLAPAGQDGRIGRNTFRAGNLLDLNMALIKMFRLNSSQSINLRVDAFNFINRANFGIPVRVLEAPAFGRATETVTPGRRVQFALKYSF